MTTISLSLDPDALREATAQAIMGVLTPEVRAQMLKSAIEAVLKPEVSSYSRDASSPLQRAFNNAVEQLARQEAVRLLAEDEEIKAQIALLMRDVADRVLSMDQEKLATRMAEAFTESLKKDRY